LRTTAGRSLLAALAAVLFIPAVQAPAQVPPDAVAVVGTQPLTRATFDHWFRVAAISLHSFRPKLRVPHRYGACPPHRHACRVTQRALRDETMQFLINALWIEGEAAPRGIHPTDAEVEKQFERTRRESFPRRKDFRKFLRQSGMTLADLHYRIRLQLLSDGLRRQAMASAAPVTDDEVAAYFAAHHKRFDEPERRDVRIVFTRTRRQALRALKLLRGGISWRRVVRLLSIDFATRSNGGWRRRIMSGTMGAAFDRALFRAPLHRPRGPVKNPFGPSSGYVVFEVGRIRPARHATLPQAAPAIRKLVASQHRAAALDDFVTDFQQRWRLATVCRSGFITLDCGNAKP